MTISPIIHYAIKEQIKESLKDNKKREEKAARERAMAAMEFNADMAERDATLGGVDRARGTRATRVKPKSKKTYGNKNYTNAKGYPRKPQSYGDK